MNLSPKGVDILKKLEGFSSTPYKCPGGVLTIGYGHAIKQGENLKEVTLDEANKIFRNDISWAERAVTRLLPNLPQNKFDALVLFVFNIGETQFVKSNVYKYMKMKMPDIAINFWKQWDKNIDNETKELMPSKGLKNRRETEIKLFKEG